MSRRRETAQQALKRLLANGPLTGLPTRAEDEQLLLLLAAGRFEPRREYREAEVNDLLREWLSSFVAPFGIDHVTLRRRLVDTGLVLRDAAGSTYWTMRRVPGMAIDPARVLSEVREERAARKRRHAP
ncbi:MAG TPA: DUF2087 domain-containing protein [Burkholderiales bacterium]|nr:DUF2087 domain-containing protein [Burkholderiales bacterium]